MIEIIQSSLEKTYSYNGYRQLIKELISEKKSTAPQNEQSESLLEYSILNDKRMDRLDKTLGLTDEMKKKLKNLTQTSTFLVLSEGWCSDAAQIIPVLHKIADFSDKIDLKIVLRDQNEELMNLFLTNGGKAIPKIIMLNTKNEVIGSWGPRSTKATKIVTDYKEIHGSVDATIKKELQIWYNKDKGVDIQCDLMSLL